MIQCIRMDVETDFLQNGINGKQILKLNKHGQTMHKYITTIK